ncbi:MAG: hypothetical protein WCV81_01540 [Microgenomates group bacterium]|jgi:hypothetical protein
MLTERYADLKLYYAYCPSDGLRPEGYFDPSPTDLGAIKACNVAIERIEKYLSPNYQWGLHYGDAKNGNLASTEEEAKKLIEFAQNNLPLSTGIVIPHYLYHGSINFWRKIRFNGATPDQADWLIEEMKKSGYVPISWDEFVIETRRNSITNDAERKVLYPQEIDQKWRKSLEFYPKF